MNPTNPSDPFADLAEAAGQSLVRIDARRHRGATGVVLGSDGTIVASARAIKRNQDIRVTVPSGDSVHADLLGRDPGTDLALLKVEADDLDLNPPPWRDGEASPVRVGQYALAVARPGQSVRAALGLFGVVGGPFRGPSGTQIDQYLELDRRLPRGFSGGLVLGADGKAAGVATSGLLRRSALVIPASTVVRVTDQLRQHGHVRRGYLGVGVYPVRLETKVGDDLGQRSAVVVVSLDDAGPAATAGVVVGDLIVSIDGQAITSPMTLRARLLDRADDDLEVDVLRVGKRQTLQLTAGDRA